MPQRFGGFDQGVSSDVLIVIAIGVILVGIALAFAGRRVWKHVMSLIGALLGGMLGFLFGAAIGGWLVGLMVAVLGSFIGSALFIYVARLGIAFVAGILALAVGEWVTGSTLAGLFLGVAVFALTLVYAETAVGIVTAVVGGLLVGFGLYLLEIDIAVTMISLLATVLFGAAVQMTALKEEADIRKGYTPVSGSPAAAALAAPVPPPIPGRSCPRCGQQMRYMVDYNRYFCDRCQRYE